MSKLGLLSTNDLGESISCIDLSHNYIAAGLLDESVALYKGSNLQEDPIRLEGHYLGIVDVSFNKDLLAVSSLDSILRVWDLNKSIKLQEFQCDQMDNWKICWFKDYLCTAGEGGRVSIFGKEQFPTFSVENSFAACIASNNYCLALGTDSGNLHIVEDPLEKRKLHVHKAHQKMIRSVRFSGDGNKAYTSSDDGDIKLTDLQKMKEIKSFKGQCGVNCIDVCPVDDKVIVSCSYDYVVRLWDTLSGQCIEQFKPFDRKDDKIWQVRFSADGQKIGVCSQQGQLNFYSRN